MDVPNLSAVDSWIAQLWKQSTATPTCVEPVDLRPHHSTDLSVTYMEESINCHTLWSFPLICIALQGCDSVKFNYLRCIGKRMDDGPAVVGKKELISRPQFHGQMGGKNC